MKWKNLLISIYKVISLVYNFIFGRKATQKINHVLFSLSLSAKGYNNYGSFNKTGEKNFIKSIADDLKLSLDIGANIGTTGTIWLAGFFVSDGMPTGATRQIAIIHTGVNALMAATLLPFVQPIARFVSKF